MFTSTDSQDSIVENTHKKVLHVSAKFWLKTMLYAVQTVQYDILE
jgi:hypothetical protein